jgi:hypothetical protein
MAGDRVVLTKLGLGAEDSEATARRPGWIGEALWTTIGELLDAFSSAECRNHIKNCGYQSVQIKTALVLAVAVYPVVPGANGSFLRGHLIKGFRYWSLRIVVLVARHARDA